QVRKRSLQCREKTWQPAVGAGHRRRRIGIDIDQPPVDSAIGGTAVDRRNCFSERAVVEHRAVNEGGSGGTNSRPEVTLEIAHDELLPARPFSTAARHQLIHLHKPRRRKRAGERGSRTRGKRKCRYVFEIEVALHLTAWPAAIHKMQDMAMF